jgi:hypothetical protein
MAFDFVPAEVMPPDELDGATLRFTRAARVAEPA